MKYLLILLWVFLYNDYFGHNWLPRSKAEVLCDGMTVLMLVVALAGGKGEG